MRRLAFEVISQSETKSPKKTKNLKQRAGGGHPEFFFDSFYFSNGGGEKKERENDA